MPSTWNINPNQLRLELNIGRDKVTKLINDLIEKGYMFKQQKNLTFTKKGELKNIYYFCDDKELLNKTTEPFRRDETPLQLPLCNDITELPNTESPLMRITLTKNSSTEDSPYINTNYYKKDIEKEDNNKKNTVLTNSFSIRTYLKEILDDFTIVNLLSAKPDLTIDEFTTLYKKATLEFKNGHCNNINSCLVKAASGKWNFRSNLSNNSNDDEAKIHRVLKSRINYYLDYFSIGSCSKDEILSKFLNECQKYNQELINTYYKDLKEKLESN
ncbi:hypothetical protein VSU16_07765 [Cetobacterium somerae]|uniref:hypothetical protein n=1 Tax=Cetobacterium somerae TaxID=188913 RepID=UPI002E7C1525|nr:hypothetical protein [Cetobacterium somerae]WVJ00711.1 hypothetical protein VSU16_07765 [Cetobacterium somerae]